MGSSSRARERKTGWARNLILAGLICSGLVAGTGPAWGQAVAGVPQVHIQPQPTPKPPTALPQLQRPGAKRPKGPLSIRVNVNMVLVPVTVTDVMGRLVTGLQRKDFRVSENKIPQTISSFSVDDAPVTVGIIFDLSGSMSDKIVKARMALDA